MDINRDIAEQQHLDMIQAVIRDRLKKLNISAEESMAAVMEQKKTMWRDLYEMDRRDMVFAKDEINANIDAAEKAEAQAAVYGRLLNSPYFGRIDFTAEGMDSEEFYIGLTGLRGDDLTDILVFDWRAPVSSMFYDYDVGPASYEAPIGVISGELTLRRQYKISDGKLEFVLDSDIKIDDDILQKELSRSASPKMRNIIATIQREQNRIIRAKAGKSMIVQGVAGSGKTSVALHKVAYLLYTQRGKITSNNLLILSPSKVFSDYISGILPELGEENVAELSFDTLARKEIGDWTEYEDRWEQLEFILAGGDPVRIKEIEIKGSSEYARWIKEYSDELLTTNFRAKTFIYSDERFEPEWFNDLFYNRWNTQPFMIRIKWMKERLFDELELRLSQQKEKKKPGKRAEKAIDNAIDNMIRCSDVLTLYSRFIDWLRDKGYADLQPVDSTSKLTYEDTFPVVLLKYYSQGSSDFSRIKHLVIDEMQDYSPLQYVIIDYLFKCPKTILGDITQNLNIYSGIRSLGEFSGELGDIEIMRLNKSFRSTMEIANFSNAICPVEGFDVVERHGEPPEIRRFDDRSEVIRAVIHEVAQAKEAGYASVGIICKTLEEAESLYSEISEIPDIDFLGPYCDTFNQGTVVTTSYMAKGLEFDVVIVPDASGENYNSECDRQSLYVACTRALHRLRLFHIGELTEQIAGDVE